MKYIKLILYFLIIDLVLFLLHSGNFFASCESLNEQEVVASTSTSSDVSSVGTDLVDLTVYSSSGEKVKKDSLEKELYEFFKLTEEEQALEVSGSSISKSNSDDEDEVEGSSSSRGRSAKRMRYTPIYGSPGEGTSSGSGHLNPYYEMPTRFAEAYDTFLQENIIKLVILEFEMALFSSSILYFTSIWRDRNSFQGKTIFLLGLLEFWENRGHRKNLAIKSIMIKYYLSTRSEKIRTILRDYVDFEGSNHLTMNNFYKNVDKIKCSDLKRSFALIILLFEFDIELLSSAFLFYLLVCSIEELKELEFKQSLELIKTNQDQISSKILTLGKKHVRKFLKAMRKNIPSMSNIKVKSYRLPIQFPLAMHKINIENFGLRFCLSLLELSLISSLSFSIFNLIFFFGSRLKIAAEVFLAFDIIKILTTAISELSDIISAILFDEGILRHLSRRIMALHNIDISNLRSRFAECIQVKNKYRELRNLIVVTDYQRNARLKKELKRRRRRT
ncbi:putative Secreted Protein [Cryptosporidium tyzzeri]|nr:putative Secreted Protein [Cryptosporidium tyzzeri]